MSTSRSALRVAVAHRAYDALLVLGGVAALAPWLVRAARDPHRRRWWRQRVLGRLPEGPPAGRPVWIHAVSVGEVKAARPLLAELRARRPDLPLVLTTGTSTGYETARAAFPGLYVCHAPLDFAPLVRRVVRRLRPRLVILLELEVWPALMRVLDEEGVPQAILNGRIREGTWRRYRRLAWWLPEYDRLDLVAAQDPEELERFARLGVPRDRLHVAGNLKHDAAAARGAAADDGPLRAELGLDDGRAVFVAGSTHDGEEQAAVAAWRAAGGGDAAHFVLAPRHPRRVEEVGRLLDRLGVPWVRRSEVAPGRPPATAVLLDTMGELEALFAAADLAFLGGSLAAVGGHNVLEPAAAGCPQLVGPHLQSCRREAELLARAGALEVVGDAAALAARVAALLADPGERRRRASAGRRAVADLAGAAAGSVALLERTGLLSLHGPAE